MNKVNALIEICYSTAHIYMFSDSKVILWELLLRLSNNRLFHNKKELNFKEFQEILNKGYRLFTYYSTTTEIQVFIELPEDHNND